MKANGFIQIQGKLLKCVPIYKQFYHNSKIWYHKNKLNNLMLADVPLEPSRGPWGKGWGRSTINCSSKKEKNKKKFRGVMVPTPKIVINLSRTYEKTYIDNEFSEIHRYRQKKQFLQIQIRKCCSLHRVLLKTLQT